ncbi:GntR family transcriptional regulator [Streptomyces sp. NPDC056437]|uniref:GntR family transcriptional regulator n=1 Tax=Streptomyces sp. NPDC056437 TaxID=3345816 RepID=UPI00368F05ED
MTPRRITFNTANSYNAEIAGRTALYRLYNADDSLLYVGISVNLAQRWDSHSRSKLWWHLVARRHVEWFDTRLEALRAEEQAEREEHPRYCDTNRMGGGWVRHARTTDPSMEQGIADTADRIRRMLAEGDYQPGDQIPTERQLAERFRVSIAMTRSAMEDLRAQLLLDCRAVGCVGTWFVADERAASRP